MLRRSAKYVPLKSKLHREGEGWEVEGGLLHVVFCKLVITSFVKQNLLISVTFFQFLIHQCSLVKGVVVEFQTVCKKNIARLI